LGELLIREAYCQDPEVFAGLGNQWRHGWTQLVAVYQLALSHWVTDLDKSVVAIPDTAVVRCEDTEVLVPHHSPS